MTLLILLLVALFILGGLVGNLDRDKAMKEFCNLECKQNVSSKYNFCC